jgi:hypothetical protein
LLDFFEKEDERFNRIRFRLNRPETLASSIKDEAHMSNLPEFPPTFELGGQKFVTRSALEHYKRTALAIALGAPLPAYEERDPEEFVPLTKASRELGVSRRTLGRRMVARATEPAAA